jgi:hypothetical protein
MARGYDEWDKRHEDNHEGVLWWPDQRNVTGIWATVERTAKYFGVSSKRVWMWIRCGRLYAVKTGNTYMVGLQGILDFRRLPRGGKYKPTPREQYESDLRAQGAHTDGQGYPLPQIPWGSMLPHLLPRGQILTSDAAIRLGVTPARVRQFLAEGRLVGENHSWGWSVTERSVREFTRLKPGPKGGGGKGKGVGGKVMDNEEVMGEGLVEEPGFELPHEQE